jgi:hypothetical protein
MMARNRRAVPAGFSADEPHEEILRPPRSAEVADRPPALRVDKLPPFIDNPLMERRLMFGRKSLHRNVRLNGLGWPSDASTVSQHIRQHQPARSYHFWIGRTRFWFGQRRLVVRVDCAARYGAWDGEADKTICMPLLRSFGGGGDGGSKFSVSSVQFSVRKNA